LKPLAAPVTKKPPTTNKLKVVISKVSIPNKYPIIAEKTTEIDSLNFKSCP